MKNTNNAPVKKWTDIVLLTFEIVCVEGCRIGGSGGALEIGGVDSNLTVIRSPLTDEPYLPGSSLKGKLRSVLEREEGKAQNGKPCKCGETDCRICVVFGAHMKPSAPSSPTRIVVRDAPLSKEWREKWRKAIQSGSPFLEEKTENIIDRKLGTAAHPRTGERIPPGAVFDGEIVFHIYEDDDAGVFSKLIRHALAVIQEGSSLGASGSRGYGKVRFEKLESRTKKLAELTV
jgi:CRISPR-associated protein Csm3